MKLQAFWYSSWNHRGILLPVQRKYVKLPLTLGLEIHSLHQSFLFFFFFNFVQAAPIMHHKSDSWRFAFAAAVSSGTIYYGSWGKTGAVTAAGVTGGTLLSWNPSSPKSPHWALSESGTKAIVCTSLYQRFQFRLLIQINNIAKDDCEIGFVDGGGDYCSLATITTIGSDWNQSLEHKSQSAAKKTIPTLWLAESVRTAILSWHARFKLINNTTECHEMVKIYAISKLIGSTEKSAKYRYL